MTGPEHYQMAERLLAELEARNEPLQITAAVAAIAQVHAMLALAAATRQAGSAR